MDNQNPNHQTSDNLIASAMTRFQETAEEQIHRVEGYTRGSPFAALSIAAAAGYVLRGLPLFALAGFLLRLALVLARPFIFVLGAVNLYHFFKHRNGPGPME